MDFITMVAENKIREAMENGEFDCLKNKGKPLNLDYMSNVPEHLRAGFTILKNAGVLPEELELKKEIVSLQKLIDCCHSEEERDSLSKKLTYQILKFDLLMEKRRVNFALGSYKSKIHKKLGKY